MGDYFSDIVHKWFETPSLEYLWVDGSSLHPRNSRVWKDKILSFDIRSSCHISRLTLQDCDSNLVYIMGVLANVDRLCIKNPHPAAAPFIIRRIAYSDGAYLPDLKELQVIYSPQRADEEFMATMSCLFQARGKESRSMPAGAGHRIVLLEGVRVQLRWGNDFNVWKRCHKSLKEGSTIAILDKILETVRSWLSQCC